MRISSSAGLAAVALLGLLPAAALAEVKVEVVSSPPGLVTLPDVLVRVSGTNLPAEGWLQNDTLVTPFFRDRNGDWFGLIGLIEYLTPGINELTVVPNDADFAKQVTFNVTAFDPDQPLFGAPRRPGACTTQALGVSAAPLQNVCPEPHAEFISEGADGTWSRLGTSAAAAATLTTGGGQKVPAMVRVEQGVIDGAAYAIAFLDDPSTNAPQPWPAGPSQTVWNGTLVYVPDALDGDTAASTNVGFFSLGKATPSTAATCASALVAQGYAVATVATTIGQPADDAAVASALLRVKERFIKTYGLPTQTVAVAQSADEQAALSRIASAYPGLDAAADSTSAANAPHCP